ncbi:MAG: hydroxymethylglutaryl-CoA synthase [Gammaproteobacteria bacterium]|nr:hydroxymethylglutaryl-CoA synthase [Gammaproteobacteria bacterium]
MTPTGISGIAVDVPPFRVDLCEWSQWAGQNPKKIHDVVGTGFRLPGPQQSVYTMAANAVLRLIENYAIDPQEVRYLALGTESSTDNSAGAIITRGMIDKALLQLGKQPLSRNCEVPEFKHACLGGVYALKGALRYLQTDGRGAKAIVVCADIALYEHGSSGEPTQGSGAVALLLEEHPTIASIDLAQAGNASDYRGVDFRKPIQYVNGDGQAHPCSNIPVFNGRYSAACYVDELLTALENMYGRRQIDPRHYIENVAAVFMHRPFRRMPENGWAVAYLFSLARGDADSQQSLRELADAAGVDFAALLAEMASGRRISDFGVPERIGDDAFPLTTQLVRSFRRTAAYQQVVLDKMALGTDSMAELGNLYTGALPAWLASGLDEAAHTGVELAGKELLLFGYGSGDAAEAIPITIVAGWESAARKIDMAATMAGAVDLSEAQYRALRQGQCAELKYQPREEFVVERVGTDVGADFQDKGIEYYRYID